MRRRGTGRAGRRKRQVRIEQQGEVRALEEAAFRLRLLLQVVREEIVAPWARQVTTAIGCAGERGSRTGAPFGNSSLRYSYFVTTLYCCLRGSIPNGGEFELSVRPLSRVKPNPLYGLETLTHGALDPNQPQFGASKDTEA
jgi:hypothetical protein